MSDFSYPLFTPLEKFCIIIRTGVNKLDKHRLDCSK